MSKKINIGIIGAGRIGYVHAKSIAHIVQDAVAGAISDVNLEAARRVADEFSIPRVYDDYREILADKSIDAVLICSPTNTHADISMEAARAGKHIFCEKPVDLTIAKIIEAGRVVRECGVKMQIGFNRRFDHNFARVRGLVESGALGDVAVIKITSRDPAPPSPEYAAVSGGLFLDCTIHDFDMARYQAMSEVVEVYARGAVTVDPAIGEAGDIDTAVVTLSFANGAIGVIDNCRRASYGYDQRLEVFGSKGMAAIENDRETTVTIATGNGVCADKPLYFFLERYMQSFAEEMRQFVDAVLHDKPVPVTIDDGLKPVAIALAAKLSLKENRPVRLDEIL